MGDGLVKVLSKQEILSWKDLDLLWNKMKVVITLKAKEIFGTGSGFREFLVSVLFYKTFFPNFRRLNGNFTDMEKFDLGAIKKLPLTHLTLGDCEITDDSMESLEEMPLTHVSLKRCSNITDKGLAYLQKKSLEWLRLGEYSACDFSFRGCKRISAKGVSNLLKNAADVQSLDLRDTCIGRPAIESLQKIYPKIQIFDDFS